MTILYIHQYYRTPEQGGCVRSFHVSQGMAKAGYRVIVITGGETQRVEKHRDVEIHYLKVPYRNEFGFLKRIRAFLSFVRKSKKEVKKLPKADLAYVMTTPLTTGLIALHLKKRGVPYIFEVGDLWPDAPIEMGAVKNLFLKTWLYRFEAKCYREAKKVVALSPAIESSIRSKVPGVDVLTVPNFSNIELFQPSERRDLSVFHIGYVGTFGKANRLSDLIDLAGTCGEQKLPIHFHLMGEGAEEQKLREIATSLKNVTFYPFGSQSDVKNLLDKVDACYVSFDPAVKVLNTGSPNKFFDGLAAGKLIIINFEGWIKELIENEGCGFSHSGFEDFKEKVSPFLQNTALLKSCQHNSRKIAENEFGKARLIERILVHIGFSNDCN